MLHALQTRIAAVIAFLLTVGALSVGVGWFGYISALDQLQQRGEADLALASDRLTGELQRYRELSVLMADHPVVTQAIAGGEGGLPQLLRQAADKTGPLDILVVDAAGRELAAASQTPAEEHNQAPYFARAMDGALGVVHQVHGRYGQRTFTFAAPIFSQDGPVVGAVIVVVSIDKVEAVWRGAWPAIFFTDALGVIFISNRSELVFQTRHNGGAHFSASKIYPPDLLRPFMDYTARNLRGRDLWRVDGQRYLPKHALHLTLPLPVIALTGEALIDVAPARLLAMLQAGVAAAICLAFGALLFLATERRRTLFEANIRLESAVEARTAQLLKANDDLRREVGERRAAEAQLKKAQADLVQAGKLSALGQMSAGISHELNQPLMAIGSFAENAEHYLERGKPEVARQNLGRIADLARRMGRIIRNLRAFAKQETEGMTDVDLKGVVAAALEITAARARTDEVELVWRPTAAPLIVRGGEVRLQQVLLNLLGNAMDAMEGQTNEKRIEITAERLGARIRLSVRDTGPGLSEPDRLFDPFYTTKQVGQDGTGQEGMGLGLSISYGLVQSFGGDIKGRNHAEGGAIFTVSLDESSKHEAAA